MSAVIDKLAEKLMDLDGGFGNGHRWWVMDESVKDIARLRARNLCFSAHCLGVAIPAEVSDVSTFLTQVSTLTEFLR